MRDYSCHFSSSALLVAPRCAHLSRSRSLPRPPQLRLGLCAHYDFTAVRLCLCVRNGWLTVVSRSMVGWNNTDTQQAMEMGEQSLDEGTNWRWDFRRKCRERIQSSVTARDNTGPACPLYLQTHTYSWATRVHNNLARRPFHLLHGSTCQGILDR